MIGIPPKDGDDTVDEFEDDKKVTQIEVGDVTPRMDLENEAESPRSIHSPEAKRLKIREERRQEQFNKKMNRFFDKHGLLDLDRVKLDGIKPRMASQEKTAGSDPTMEVRDLPMIPSSASLSSKKSLRNEEIPF
jgi:acetylglutamate synthase